jgi:hypothetical protein
MDENSEQPEPANETVRQRRERLRMAGGFPVDAGFLAGISKALSQKPYVPEMIKLGPLPEVETLKATRQVVAGIRDLQAQQEAVALEQRGREAWTFRIVVATFVVTALALIVAIIALVVSVS